MYSDVIAIYADHNGEIQIYPNPTTNDLFMDITDDIDAGTYTISIIDVVGKETQQELEFSANKKTYKFENFRELKPGVYIIRVMNKLYEVIIMENVVKN